MNLEQELEKGWTLLEDGDVPGARRVADKLATGAPDEPDVLLLQAACAREEGELPDALALLDRAAAADPDWATPRLWSAELIAADPERLSTALAHAAEALELAEEEEEFLAALTLKAGLEVDLGKVAAARKTLGELPPVGTGDIDPQAGLEIAHLFLAVGDDVEARQRFQSLVDGDPDDADAWHGLGLAAEAQGDEEGKRAAWGKTRALDERAELEDPLLAEDEMVEVAEQALAELPERARKLIQHIPIVVVDLPAREDVERGLDPRLLGLFEGTSYRDGSSAVAGQPHLTQILLFRKNLERSVGDVDELRDEIRTTLLHEIGHFFGMSEDDLAEVGLD